VNVGEAEDAVTEAQRLRDEAQHQVARAESAHWVTQTNLTTAQAHLAAMTRWVEDRERVLRELTIAEQGGHHPPKENE
jgi:hypothetical protein